MVAPVPAASVTDPEDADGTRPRFEALTNAMQRTTLGDILDRALEVTWLTAVMTVPALVNVYSVRAFEGDKVPFLRSLALFAAALWIARRAEAAGRSTSIPWRQPAVVAAGLLVLCALISTALSIAPAIAFWGSYERVQGTYALVACAVLFLAFISTAGPPQISRLVTAMLIASIVPCVYALLQVYGADPIAWDVDRVVRVHSTAGNPIFLGAFIILVMPLALARLLEASQERRHVSAAAYFGCLSLNGLALACTQSRGPALALAVGLGVLVLAAAARRKRRLAALAGGTVIALFLVAAVGVRVMPLQARWDAASAMEPASGNALVRLLIWDGTVDLLRSRPWLPFGYGLDTFRLVFPPFYPAALAPLESRDAVPDRAHNDVFDTVVHLGFVGLLLRLVLLIAVMKTLLDVCGITNRWTLYVVTVLIAALAAVAVDASYLGVAIGAGLLAALFVPALASMIVGRAIATSGAASRRELLAFGLLGAVAAHVAELQVGIPTATTELYFWMLAAAGLALTREGDVESNENVDAPSILGVGVAVLLSAVIFMFFAPPAELSRRLWIVASLLGITWVGALAITIVSERLRPAGIATFGLASVGGALAFALPYSAWIGSKPSRPGDLLMSDYITHFASVWYAGAFLLILFGGLVSVLLANRERAPFSSRPGLQAVLVPSLLACAGWWIVTTNLAAARADMYAKIGSLYETRRDWQQAAATYGRASELQGGESTYALNRARVLLTLGTEVAATDPIAADGAYDAAEHAARLALEANPLETDNVALMARVNRRIAAASADDRPHAMGEADRFYAAALELSPNRVALWREYAEFLLENEQPDNALTALDHAVELDGTQAELHKLRADVYLKLQRYEDAVAAYDSVLALQPRAVPALTGKGFALTRLGRPREGIDANLRALEIAPNDPIVRRNLAALYRDQGQIDAALEHALVAVELAHGPERAQLEELVRRLREDDSEGSVRR